MKIGVDFDRVLFDTAKFNDYLKEEVKGLKHVETPPYNEHDVYSPEIHAEMCGIEAEEIYDALKNLEKFLYSDIDALKNFDGEVVIVTRGEKKFQKEKIKSSGAGDYVENIIIVEKGSKDVADIDFLIDDQKREIEKARLPGFEFDRGQHRLEEALEEAINHEA